jgi:hypothetical protein
VGSVRDSFHPPDPTLIKRDAKAAMLALMQQSVCAIELIGLQLFGAGTSFDALRSARDKFLASTAAGREWIALFERTQFTLLSAVMRDAKLLTAAGDLLRQISRSAEDPDAVFTEADADRASDLLKKVRTKVKAQSVQRDLDVVGQRIRQLAGRSTQQVIESLMRRKPGRRG